MASRRVSTKPPTRTSSSSSLPRTSSSSRTQPPQSASSAVLSQRTSIPPSLSAKVVENGILAAAMKVFAKRGYAATRVEDVLDEAGVARRTFYRYFTSKEDVLSAVYELAMNELLRVLEDADLASADDPLANVRQGVDLYLDFHVENAALLRILVVEAVRSDSPLSAHRRSFRARMLKAMARAAAATGVAPLDGFTYVALVSALEGVALELLEGVEGSERSETKNESRNEMRNEVRRAKHVMHALLASGLSKQPSHEPSRSGRPPTITKA